MKNKLYKACKSQKKLNETLNDIFERLKLKAIKKGYKSVKTDEKIKYRDCREEWDPIYIQLKYFENMKDDLDEFTNSIKVLIITYLNFK